MIDIVFPKGNEAEFIKIAKRLGYEGLCFVYSSKDFKSGKIKLDLKIKYGGIVSENSIKELKNLRSKTDAVLVECKDKTRQVIEQNKNAIVFGFENDTQRDFIHQRRSGLNHIMCNLATKNNIKVGLSFNCLLNASDRKRNILIGRMMHNIKLCRKYKTKIVIGSFASKPYEMRPYNDLTAFFSTLGLHPSEAKGSL